MIKYALAVNGDRHFGGAIAFTEARRRRSSTVIRVTAKKTYADVLSILFRKLNPDVSHTWVMGAIIPTRNGDVLIKIRKDFNIEKFIAEVTKTVECIWHRS